MAATVRPLRILSRSPLSISPARRTLTTLTTHPSRPVAQPALRLTSAIYQPTSSLSYTFTSRKGLQPDSDNPSPPNTEPQLSSSTTEPTPLSEEVYHEKADSYLDRLVLALEEKAETDSAFEVEYDVRLPSLPPYTQLTHHSPARSSSAPPPART
jgi:hypothetical protein